MQNFLWEDPWLEFNVEDFMIWIIFESHLRLHLEEIYFADEEPYLT